VANKEILLVVDVFSNEKEIDKEVVFQAIESALETATVRRYAHPIKARVMINRKTGDYSTFRQWEVVGPNPDCAGDVEFPTTQVLLEVAQIDNPNMAIGDCVEEEIESVEFGRIAAQHAKQAIIQKVREAERKKIVDAYRPRIGELITGIIKRIEKGSVFLDLGGHVEGFIAKEDMIPREAIRTGDRIRGYLKDVRLEPRGPQLFVSRTDPELLIALFRLEVPEVSENVIEIMGAARDGESLLHQARPPACSMKATTSFKPFWRNRSVKTKGLVPRTLRVSLSITARSAMTCGARSALLMMRRSERVIAGPPFRGIFSPWQTEMT
jgi:N utilization substance protein A